MVCNNNKSEFRAVEMYRKTEASMPGFTDVQRTYGVCGESVYFPAGVFFGSEAVAMMCVLADAAPFVIHEGFVFACHEWLASEFPESADEIRVAAKSAIKSAMFGACGSDGADQGIGL